MSKWIFLGWLSLGAGSLLAACGSDEVDGGNPGGSNACVQACQRMSSAACGDYANTDCKAPAQCPADEACPTELNAFYGCIANTAMVTCSAGQTRATGCEKQATTYVSCASCAAAPGDTTCGACVKTSCCEELQDWSLASDGAGFDACIQPCQTQACDDDCIARFPISGAAYKATLECQETSCERPCVCGASASDDTCLRCVKANCCDALLVYNNASDVAGFSGCVRMCAATDQACADACVARFPEAGDAFAKLSTTCLDTTCLTACSGP